MISTNENCWHIETHDSNTTHLLLQNVDITCCHGAGSEAASCAQSTNFFIISSLFLISSFLSNVCFYFENTCFWRGRKSCRHWWEAGLSAGGAVWCACVPDWHVADSKMDAQTCSVSAPPGRTMTVKQGEMGGGLDLLVGLVWCRPHQVGIGEKMCIVAMELRAVKTILSASWVHSSGCCCCLHPTKGECWSSVGCHSSGCC